MATRDSFHHGNLREALIETAWDLAREGGPEAITLREVARRVGVVPNAAYRHFANHEELLERVRERALASAAVAMRRELARVKPGADDKEFARASIRAIGRAYLRFAQTEPGLFRTAFQVITSEPPQPGNPDSDLKERGPFGLLSVAIDRMVDAGLLEPARRPQAEFVVWSAVHGLAALRHGGPLSTLPRSFWSALEERVIEMAVKGLS